jgi:hypothetical protein
MSRQRPDDVHHTEDRLHVNPTSAVRSGNFFSGSGSGDGVPPSGVEVAKVDVVKTKLLRLPW